MKSLPKNPFIGGKNYLICIFLICWNTVLLYAQVKPIEYGVNHAPRGVLVESITDEYRKNGFDRNRYQVIMELFLRKNGFSLSRNFEDHLYLRVSPMKINQFGYVVHIKLELQALVIHKLDIKDNCLSANESMTYLNLSDEQKQQIYKVSLEAGSFFAITWDRGTLIRGSKNDIHGMVESGISSLLENYLNDYLAHKQYVIDEERRVKEILDNWDKDDE